MKCQNCQHEYNELPLSSSTRCPMCHVTTVIEDLSADRKVYMNIYTGSVGLYDSWDYQDEDDNWVNAVDLGEVVEVEDDGNGNWVEV
jgi:rubredoxin